MLSDDVKMLLAKRNISKSELARLLDDSPQNLGLKFKRNTFKDEDLKKIFEVLSVEATVTYKEKESGEIIFNSTL